MVTITGSVGQKLHIVLVKEAIMDPIINVDRVSWYRKTRYRILEHMLKISKDLPVSLADPITGFAIVNRREIKRSVDECILVKQVNVLPGGHQIVLSRKGSRRARGLN
jgi:hypothetical protein